MTSIGSKRVRQGITVTTSTLFVSIIVFLSLMVFRTDGECHEDHNQNGCLAKFDFIGIHSAMVMIFFDAGFFTLFCLKWYRVIKDAESVCSHSSKSTSIQIRQLKPGTLHVFVMQFTLTIVAMSSCTFDAIMHLLWYDEGKTYHVTMVYFLLDCAVIATCIFLMIPEAQKLANKLVCSYCFG